MHTQAELERQRERGDGLELEKESFKQQTSDIREKLIKTQAELDELKSTLENMVPRCVRDVFVRVGRNNMMLQLMYALYAYTYMHIHAHVRMRLRLRLSWTTITCLLCRLRLICVFMYVYIVFKYACRHCDGSLRLS
jgi:hypothetical protein